MVMHGGCRCLRHAHAHHLVLILVEVVRLCHRCLCPALAHHALPWCCPIRSFAVSCVLLTESFAPGRWTPRTIQVFSFAALVRALAFALAACEESGPTIRSVPAVFPCLCFCLFPWVSCQPGLVLLVVGLLGGGDLDLDVDELELDVLLEVLDLNMRSVSVSAVFSSASASTSISFSLRLCASCCCSCFF